RKVPRVFTEQGVAILSSVLRGRRAVQVNVAIMRTYVCLREILATHKDLARKVEEHDRQIRVLFDAVRKLLAAPTAPKSIRSDLCLPRSDMEKSPPMRRPRSVRR